MAEIAASRIFDGVSAIRKAAEWNVSKYIKSDWACENPPVTRSARCIRFVDHGRADISER